MAQAKITLLGLYGYFDSLGGDLFQFLTLPEGMNKETFTDTLFLDYGERAVLYPNPELFQRMIGAWSSKWSVELTRIAKTLTEDYEPLWNIDRYEVVTDTIEDEANERNTGTLSESQNGTGSLSESEDIDGTSRTTNAQTIENTTSAYNSSSYEPDNRSQVNGSGSDTTGTDRTLTQSTGSTNSVSQTTGSTKDNEYSRDYSHNGHFYGNGGVTMSQQMAESEIKLREKYNLYHEACKLFSDDLLLYIY